MIMSCVTMEIVTITNKKNIYTVYMKALSLSLLCEHIRVETSLHVKDVCTLGLRKRVKYSDCLDHK